MPAGQPSCGHIAGDSPAARQPRYVMSQPQPAQKSGAQSSVTRQVSRSRPWHTPASPLLLV